MATMMTSDEQPAREEARRRCWWPLVVACGRGGWNARNEIS